MKIEKKTWIPVLGCLVISLAASNGARAEEQSGQEGGGKLSEKDRNFLMEAAHGGLMEVQAGELGRTRGSNPAVKDLGERMVTDHTQANEDLKQLASQKGVELPTTLESGQHQQELDRLNNLSGADFDREYLQMMVQDHQEHLRKFQSAAESTGDSEIKAFAQRVAGVIEQHLNSARQIQNQVSPGSNQGQSGTQGNMGEEPSSSSQERSSTREGSSIREERSIHQGSANRENTTRRQGATRNQGNQDDDDSGDDSNGGDDDDKRKKRAGGSSGQSPERKSATQPGTSRD